MYGSVGKWFYTHIAGITPLSAGFEKIQIRPYIPKKLLSAEATVETVRGDVTVKWKKAHGKINLLVDIPNGSCANVFFGKNEYSVTSGTHVYTIDEDDN